MLLKAELGPPLASAMSEHPQITMPGVKRKNLEHIEAQEAVVMMSGMGLMTMSLLHNSPQRHRSSQSSKRALRSVRDRDIVMMIL